MMAADSGHFECMRLLVEDGRVDLDVKCNVRINCSGDCFECGFVSMYRAFFRITKHVSFLQHNHLLHAYFIVPAVLFVKCHAKKFPIVYSLLSVSWSRRIGFGAQINPTLQLGYTALILASIKGDADCVRMLLECGADKYAQDNVRNIV